MFDRADRQKLMFSARAVAALALLGTVAACHSPARPSRNGRDLGSNSAQPTGNWPDLNGTYMLTLSASNRCPPDLPPAMRARTYTARIAQTAGTLTITLPSVFPPFGITSFGPDNRFTGVFGPNNEIFLRFQFEEWFLEYPVTEFAAIGGTTGAISPNELSGEWDGYMRGVVTDENGRNSRIAACTAPDHAVAFSR